MVDLASFFTANGVAILASIGLFLALFATYRLEAARLDRRAEELDVAGKALVAHYKAVQLVLEDSAPSKDLKLSICRFSDAVTDRDFGIFLANLVKNSEEHAWKISAEARKIHQERAELSARYKHLNQAFNTAAEAGLVALMLRWPETAAAFARIVGWTAADKRLESQITMKATTFIRTRDGDHNGHGHSTVAA